MKEEFRTSLLDEKKDAALNTALEQWVEQAEIVYTADGEAWKLPENETTEDAEEQEESDEAEDEVPAEEDAPTALFPAEQETAE